MMILTVIVVAIFRTTTVLGNAYGELALCTKHTGLAIRTCVSILIQ